MINDYPDFTKISISLKDEIERFVCKYEPYSDFNFVSMFSWNTTGMVELSYLNDNLVIKLPDYIEDDASVLSLLGTNKVDDTIDLLLQSKKYLSLVPEIVCISLSNKNKLNIAESDKNFDYVYSLDDLISLNGQKYKDKRNRLNKFLRQTGHHTEVVHKNIIDNSKTDQVQSIFNLWLQNSSNASDFGSHEEKAINILMNNFNHLDLLLSEVYVEGELAGFSINEVLDNNFSMCHFEKTSMRYDFLYDFLVHETSKELRRLGSVFVNWEQDLGIPGLRQSKKSFRPVRYLKKFDISRK